MILENFKIIYYQKSHIQQKLLRSLEIPKRSTFVHNGKCLLVNFQSRNHFIEFLHPSEASVTLIDLISTAQLLVDKNLTFSSMYVFKALRDVSHF